MGCIKSRPMKARITPPSDPYYLPFHRINKQLNDYQRELAIYQMEIEDGFRIDSNLSFIAVRSWIVDSHPADVEQRIEWLTLVRNLIIDMARLSVRISQRRGMMTNQRGIYHSSCPDLARFDDDCDLVGNEDSDLAVSSLSLG
ncbi:hypothetical protein PRIPAC_71408 [Pristionchus pacificus]|uniref:Uncharacterized protein n=1 Tax=Pristionchus pacificus TaxID=54126 RepID=A0A454XZA0_PRIPA|nr:hypothetical protein PRIPAC_71408 [Pristionchus pacificus]|eukprot:PDM76738.1 hypothetical protein PRIPAC_42133 [Pristionchus pacificus]